MSLNRYAAKRDVAEREIVNALRLAGCRVWFLDQPFDLLCGRAGKFFVFEVKTGKRKLNDEQQRQFDDCRSGGLPVFLVRNPTEALAALGGEYER